MALRQVVGGKRLRPTNTQLPHRGDTRRQLMGFTLIMFQLIT